MTEAPARTAATRPQPMRYATVCSGVEGMSLAVAGMGWTPVFFSEVAPFPCAVLRHHFPNVPNLGDMTKIQGDRFYGTVDFLAGGTPCTSFSVAGNRKGLDDPRGRLMLHFARLAHEIKPRWLLWENVPGCLSSGGGNDFATLLSCLCGWDVAVPKGGWRNSGVVTHRDDNTYGLAWRVIDAQFCRVDGFAGAVPQRRRRVWLVANLGGWQRPAEVLFVGEGLSGHPPPRREAREETPGGAGRRPRGTGKDDVAGTVTSNDAERGFTSTESIAAGGHLVLDGAPATCMNFEMFNVGHGCSPAILAERAEDMLVTGGGVVSLPNGQANASPTKDYAGTLSCDHEAPIVCLTPWDTQGNRIQDPGGVSPTLAGCDGGGGRNPGGLVFCPGPQAAGHAPIVVHGSQDPCVAKDLANGVGTNNGLENVVFDHAHGKEIDVGMTVTGDHESRITDTTHLVVKANPRTYTHHERDGRVEESDVSGTLTAALDNTSGLPLCLVDGVAGDRQTTGIGDDGDPCPTLQAAHHHAVALVNSIRMRAGCEGGGKGALIGVDLSHTLATSNDQTIISGRTVRRLTPLECERLMGFPDNWTRIPKRFYAKKPTHRHFKKFPDLYERLPDGTWVGYVADSPRYKACGNSWAVNCARWVCMRIALVNQSREGLE